MLAWLAGEKSQESVQQAASFITELSLVLEKAYPEKLSTEGEQKLLGLSREGFIGILIYYIS